MVANRQILVVTEFSCGGQTSRVRDPSGLQVILALLRVPTIEDLLVTEMWDKNGEYGVRLEES